MTTPGTLCWLCGRPSRELIARGGSWICTNCADQVTRLEAENARLRARLQVAESALRLVLDAVAGLPESPEVVCTHCHRPLVVPQVLDHIAMPTGWVCMPCAGRASAVAWAPLQGGDLPDNSGGTP